jgi:hypothetical protein
MTKTVGRKSRATVPLSCIKLTALHISLLCYIVLHI